MNFRYFLIAAIALAAAGCTSSHKTPLAHHDPMKPASAVTVLHGTTGHPDVEGIVRFTRSETGIRVEATVRGLAPGKHGFHIHTHGDCSSGDGTSAGGHFNPDGHPHAAPASSERHAGDLGNLFAGPDGVAEYRSTDPILRLSGHTSIIGRSIIVHAAPDDLTTQPTGNAGARVACGVIGLREE